MLPNLGGIFRRWREATRPTSSFLRHATGAERGLHSLGAISVPAVGGYYIGDQLGAWDLLRTLRPQQVQNALPNIPSLPMPKSSVARLAKAGALRGHLVEQLYNTRALPARR